MGLWSNLFERLDSLVQRGERGSLALQLSLKFLGLVKEILTGCRPHC